MGLFSESLQRGRLAGQRSVARLRFVPPGETRSRERERDWIGCYRMAESGCEVTVRVKRRPLYSATVISFEKSVEDL